MASHIMNRIMFLRFVFANVSTGDLSLANDAFSAKWTILYLGMTERGTTACFSFQSEIYLLKIILLLPGLLVVLPLHSLRLNVVSRIFH